MISPFTPQECMQPPPGALRANWEGGVVASACFFSAAVGRCTQNPWIWSDVYSKSLIVDRKCPTGLCEFSTHLDYQSTCCLNFSTCRFSRFASRSSIYLSLFKEEEEREKAGKREFAIHGLRKLRKKASTGCTSLPRVFRGCRIVKYLFQSKRCSLVRAYPRVHGLFCPWSTWVDV